MADNSDRTPGSGETIRTEDKGGVKTQVIVIDVGGSGAEQLLGDLLARLPVGGFGAGGFWPERAGVRRGPVANGQGYPLLINEEGALLTRGPVLTDEQSIREDFPGAALTRTLSGTVTLTNGAATITGTSTAFLTELEHGAYIRLSADAESDYAQVASIESDTAATLEAAYTGTGGSATGALITTFRPITGSGGSFSVTNSALTIASGTTISAATLIHREVDYGPIALTFAGVTMSQRIANNDMVLGLHDAPTSPSKYARFRATGTTNTSLIFESAAVRTGTPAAADIETTTLTLPNGRTTATALRYRIELLTDRVRAYVDDVLVADHTLHMPDAYDVMDVVAGHINAGSAPATSTNLVIDAIGVNNFNQLHVALASNAESVVAAAAPGQMYSGSGTANNTNLVVLDCSQIRALVVQITSIGVGTVSFQCSNDGTTWVGATGYSVSAGSFATGGTATGHWVVPVVGRYMRLRTTAYTSGTQTVVVMAMQHAPPLNILQTIYSGTQSVNLGTGGVAATSLGKAEDAVAASGDTGIAVWAIRRDTPATNVSAAGDYAELAVNGVGGLWTSQASIATGGATLYRLLSAASTNANSVKASAGKVYKIWATNTNAAVRYVKLYNKASSPTVGTDTPVMTLAIPGNAAGAGAIFDAGDVGANFATGIAIATTTGAADNDNTGVAANEVIVHVLYG